MKDFEYYSEPMRKVVSLSTVKQRLYEHVGFNPDNFDSKKQAQEFGLSKKHYQKILCELYKDGLIERLNNGKLKIN